jgi:hypothetical protein
MASAGERIGIRTGPSASRAPVHSLFWLFAMDLPAVRPFLGTAAVFALLGFLLDIAPLSIIRLNFLHVFIIDDATLGALFVLFVDNVIVMVVSRPVAVLDHFVMDLFGVLSVLFFHWDIPLSLRDAE